MALFKRDFNRPGPGVPKNAPRKKGFSRFIEVLGRDFGNLVKLNVIYQLCILPSQLFLTFTILSFLEGIGLFMIIGAVLALAGCLLVGPATTATYYIITKMLRDEPGFIWHDFKKLFKENFKSSILPGIIYGLILGAQVFAVVYYFILGAQLNVIMMGLYFFSLLIFYMAMPYFFVQAGYLDMGTGGLLKNSILLSLGYVPRSLVGAILGTGLVIVQILVLPLSVITLFIFGYTIPILINLMWVWPPINKSFKIEETLVKRAGGEWPEEPEPEPDPEPEEAEETEEKPVYLEYEDYMQDELEAEQAEIKDDPEEKDPPAAEKN